ncbi:uncharacterized protein UHOD_11884 [Ustilago sp. UG-2017b]|nr:uncharacterized protein UHOD_11884 [Ustilago sp. UG-2017b]
MPFTLLWTFGCLAWVNIPKAKRKKLDEPAIPAIFVGYDEEHKGWKFLAPRHNLLIFWSNSACFLQDKSWCVHEDTTPIQDTNALHYKDTTDTTNLDPAFKYPTDTNDSASEPNPPPTSSVQASDGSTPNGSRPTTPPGSPLITNRPNGWRRRGGDIQDGAFSEYLSMQKVQYYHNKFAATHEMFPWLHPTTLAELLRIYPRMFPPAAEMHRFQEKLCRSGRLADIGLLPAYNAEAYTIIVTNLKPSIKEALAEPDQIHWREAIKAKMDGLESMQIWETVDRLEGATFVDSKLVLQVKTDANNIPYKFKARFCVCGFSQREGIDYDEIFTPVVPKDAIRTLLAIAARFDWEIDSIDITQAYLNADLHHHIYLKPPEGAEVPLARYTSLSRAYMGSNNRAGNGIKNWMHIYSAWVSSHSSMRLATQINQIKKAIISKWKITDNGLATEFLKIKITWDWKRRTIDLDQRTYIKEIVKEWITLQEKTWTPMTHTPPTPPDFEADRDIKARYPIFVGKLLWVATTVRLDISFAINTLARHMSKPSEDAMQAALRVVKYLNQTHSEVLQIGGEERNKPTITAYTDSNWASDPTLIGRAHLDRSLRFSAAW